MQIGLDVLISEYKDIRYPENIVMGNHVSIDSFFVCSTKLTIKDYVHVGPHVSIIGGKDAYCEIGNFSGMAAGCRIVCASDKYQGDGIINPLVPKEFRDEVINAPVILEDFVTLGTNVVVLPGVKLAIGSVVATGSVVTKDTLPWTMYAGYPAKPFNTRKKDKMIQFAKELGYREY